MFDGFLIPRCHSATRFKVDMVLREGRRGLSLTGESLPPVTVRRRYRRDGGAGYGDGRLGTDLNVRGTGGKGESE